MPEKTIELEIPALLPGVMTAEDGCLDRLEAALRHQPGLQRVHLERERQPAALCLHYDPSLTSVAEVRRAAERAGAVIAGRFHHDLITIEGMDCSDCVKVIEHGLGRLEGVLTVNVNYPLQKMRVEFDTQKTSRAAIEKRLRGLGYTLPVEGWQSWYQANREILFSVAAGALVVLGWAGETFLGLPHGVAVAVYGGAYLLGGWEVAGHAWHALRERHFDTDLLMVAAAIGAACLGAFAEGAFLLFLFSLGHALEERALDRARQAVRALADLTPKTALVKRAGGVQEMPVEQLLLAEVVLVRPGVRIPVDGEVLAGRSAVNQAPVTGESVPVEKAPGDRVFAGTINGDGALEVNVTRLAQDSTLARVMQMVEAAQKQQSPTQQTVEGFERVFVPVVLAATALVSLVPPLFGVPFPVSFLRAMTLLVAASPCALALGTPAAILAGVAQAARNGVLIKGGAHLENLGRLKVIAFDKTGTLTHGRPEVTEVVALDERWTEADLLALAGALESGSGHPLARAVVRAAQDRGLALPTGDEVTALTGRGLRARVHGQAVLIGNRALLEEARVSVSAEAQTRLEALQAAGQTVMLVAVDGVLAGVIAVADTLRPEAAPTMTALKRLGVHATVLLTGDHLRVAQAIAREAGLTALHADLLPEDKARSIRMLLEQFGPAGMVGDGVNDAPALANATVGIAMGGAGTDVALETADVALMGDDLSKLPFAVGLGRATRAIIQQNLLIAAGVSAGLITASLAGWAGLGAAIIFHEGSTLLVVLNALQLLGYREARPRR